jgi:F-type H+-transporting ATPase subunit b
MHVLYSFILLAEEAGAKPEPSIIWKWLNFLLLAGILGYLIAKNLGPFLSARTKQIQDSLAAGEKARAEANARAAAVQAQLANLGVDVDRMRAEARHEREREAERLRLDSERDMASIQQRAAQEIESAGKLARLEVQSMAAKMAIELAERKVRARMSPEVEAALLGNFIDGLSNGASPHVE